MGKIGIAVMAILILLPLISIANAVPNIVILNYTIYDRFGNKAFEGWTPSKTNPVVDTFPSVSDYQYTFYQNITAGDYFYINVTLNNTGDAEEPSGQFVQSKVRDSRGNYMGDNREWYPTRYRQAAIANFTQRAIDPLGPPADNNPFGISIGETIVINSTMNTTRFLYPGNYSLLFQYFGSGISKYQWIIVPINNPGTSFYLNLSNINFTNYNDIAYFDTIKQNWTLIFNFTLQNLGNLAPDVAANMTSLYCNSQDASRSYGNCSTPLLPRIIFTSINQQTNFSCQVFNVSNTSNLHCDFRLDNATYNYRLEKSLDFGQLGVPNYAPPSYPYTKTWWDYISAPYSASLYAVPGSPFNISFGFYYIQDQYDGGGNITYLDNFNLSFISFSASGTKVLDASELLWKDKTENLNVSSSAAGTFKWLDYNLTETIPSGSTSQYSILRMYVTEHLFQSILAQYPPYPPGNNPGPPPPPCLPIGVVPIEININQPWCTYFIPLVSANLIFTPSSPSRELIIYVPPGRSIPVPFELQNPFPRDENFDLSSVFVPTSFQAHDPLTLTFSTPALVPRAYSSSPGRLSQSVSVAVPYGTPQETYIYQLISSLRSNPNIKDYAILHVLVSAHDVEIVSINKNPDLFTYDPEKTPAVGLKVTIRNNLRVTEKVKLKLAIGSAAPIDECGGASIDLGPEETKTIDCGASADLTGLTNDNIVVAADLSLLSGADSSPENNHFVEILSIITSGQIQETVPETSPLVFLSMLLLSMFAIRRVKKT